MKIVIVDYGMGNLHSIKRALEECGADDISIADDPQALSSASKIILPGVGSFTDAMDNLNRQGWPEALHRAVDEGVSILGICLGMQLLADKGYEGGETRGLGFIPGEVVRFEFADPSLRIPHVGWNEIYPQGDSLMLENIRPGTDFYFVHSYHFIPQDAENILATSNYGGDFVAAVVKGLVVGVQFHPEKSQRAGFGLLRNYLTYY